MLSGRRSSAVLSVISIFALSSFGSSASARELRVGKDAPSVAETVALAEAGDVVLLPKGTWRGNIVIDKKITLRGQGGVLDGGGKGTVLQVDAAGAIIEDLTVRGSGKDLAKNEACVLFTKDARAATIRRVRVEDCAFGIYIDRAQKAKILDNRVVGTLEGHRSNRGNGIHLFNARYLLVKGNHVTGGRDGIYVSVTEDSLIENNKVSDSRYCVHYMFAYRNKLIGNTCLRNSEGYALMQSRNIVVKNNVALDNEGRGLLFRDATLCTIVGNRMERNGEGMFFYSSTENLIAHNIVRNNRVGVRVWAGSLRNEVRDNRFIANQTQIFFVGSKDIIWGKKGRGNYWSDYLGWDQDGDGLGDRPYRVGSFQTALVARFPAAALLMRSPALELISLLETRMPLLRTPTIVDRRPLMGKDKGSP